VTDLEMVRDAVVLGLYFALDAIDLLPLCKSCFIEDIAMKNLKRLVHDREIILQNIGLYKFSLERGIRNHGSALGKTPDNHGYYHFSIECLPSSRDDSYYCEYRWDTAEKAFKFWRENRSKIIATNLEIRNFFDKFHRT